RRARAGDAGAAPGPRRSGVRPAARAAGVGGARPSRRRRALRVPGARGGAVAAVLGAADGAGAVRTDAGAPARPLRRGARAPFRRLAHPVRARDQSAPVARPLRAAAHRRRQRAPRLAGDAGTARLFERVRGARLHGTAPAGATITVDAPVRTATTTLRFRASAKAGSDGRFALVYPYAGGVELGCPSGRRLLTIPESAVTHGDDVAADCAPSPPSPQP